MKKIIRYALIGIIAIILFPIKLFCFNNRMDSNKTVLICKYQAITGPEWEIIYKNNEKLDVSSSIDLIGNNIPELQLRCPMYELNDCQFIFIGEFDNSQESLFHVDKWNIIAPAFNLNCLPYGLNIFQFSPFVNKNEAQEREYKIRDFHLQYKDDKVIKNNWRQGGGSLKV